MYCSLISKGDNLFCSCIFLTKMSFVHLCLCLICSYFSTQTFLFSCINPISSFQVFLFVFKMQNCRENKWVSTKSRSRKRRRKKMETKTDNEVKGIKWKEWEQEIIAKECLKCSIIQLFFSLASSFHISRTYSLLHFSLEWLKYKVKMR